MRVRRDFEKVYELNPDPWNIQEAKSGRYNFYFQKILEYTRARRTVLDIGCGTGAFLARFQGVFEKLLGVEVSSIAVAEARKKRPSLEIHQGDAQFPERWTYFQNQKFDVIIFSDVICYFSEKKKNRILRWISEHLSPEGIAFIAAWTPGGKYLNHEELERLVKRYFVSLDFGRLETEHSFFIVKPKCFFVALTVDYEVWHPPPAGVRVDWEKDLFEPARHFLEMMEKTKIPITFFAEMGEYFWLKENDPATAEAFFEPLKEALRLGGDVQLHLHPNWLPELGARREGDKYHWDWTKAKAADYPGDLEALIRRCKQKLEQELKKVKADYQVVAFRAGAYQVQPFERLQQALRASGLYCDSSVYAGGYSEERGYDFRYASSRHQPYWADSFDPQFLAPPAERFLIELPIFTWKNAVRWFLDDTEGTLLDKRLFHYLKNHPLYRISSEEFRFRKKLQRLWSGVYFRLHRFLKLPYWIPRSLAHAAAIGYPPPEHLQNDYFVAIGHTKGTHDWEGLKKAVEELRKDGRFLFRKISELAQQARSDLQACSASHDIREEIQRQVERERTAVLGEERNEKQSAFLQDLLPLDRRKVLDLGCGAGYWSKKIAERYPWMEVVGVDAGQEFIQKAKEKFAGDRVAFQVVDFHALPFPDETFDAVYADNCLEHAFDIRQVLREVYRVLTKKGVLLAALPPDGYQPQRSCDNHNWKSIPKVIEKYFREAGFVDMAMKEIDTLRRFGMAPYPPSNDKMLYIRAWKERLEALDRVRSLMDWLYQHVEPSDEKPILEDPHEILSQRRALCAGYALTLKEMLSREGFNAKHTIMLARHHPRGRGKDKVDSHNVVLLFLNGREYVLDPTVKNIHPYPLEMILKNPRIVKERSDPDDRYVSRGYRWWDGFEWYSRVYAYWSDK